MAESGHDVPGCADGAGEPMNPSTNERGAMLAALAAWIRQRPGFEVANYATATDYRRDCRSAAQDLNDARELLMRVEARPTIDAEALKAALAGNFMGRLTWRPKPGGRTFVLDYTTGQYWPTEYRAAVCAVLRGALWAYWRAEVKATYPARVERGEPIRYLILASAKNAVSSGVYRRWFANA